MTTLGVSSFNSVLGENRNAVYQQTDRALKRLQDFKPFVVGDSPILVDVNCVSRRAAELLCFMAMFRRISATQVAFEADTMVDVSKVLSFLVASGTLMVWWPKRYRYGDVFLLLILYFYFLIMIDRDFYAA